MDVNQVILDLALIPINESQACGINAKYEPDYEALETEIAKSQSLSSESTDWDNVARYCENILRNVSKDFPTSCYYAYALTLKDGYQGMFNGFSLIEKLSETYWDNLFPPVKRLRARQNSAQWFIEKAAEYLEKNEPQGNDLTIMSDLASTVKNLDFLLSEKMADSAPNFSDLSRPLKRLKEIAKSQVKKEEVSTPQPSVPEPIAEPSTPAPSNSTASLEVEPEVTTSAQVNNAVQPTVQSSPAKPKPSQASTATFEPVGDIQNDQDAKKAFKQVQDTLKKLAGFHAQVKASDPKRFRYSRIGLWGSLDKLPPAKDSKTQLPAPAADKLKKVAELFEANEFLECIELAEKSADKMPYWFDGNRYIALSLEALGAEYEKSKQALETELCNFIQRVPKIIDLQYSNGEPFVSETCKNWLQSLSDSGNETQSAEQDSIAPALAGAKKLALAGKLTDAFDLLNEQPAKTKRDKFKIKMACAELACLNGQVKVGIPMLERLVDEVRTLTVAEWESDFLSKALALLVNAYEKLDETDLAQKQQKREAAYDQLCWYNPALISQ